jgi:hypothetical protein
MILGYDSLFRAQGVAVTGILPIGLLFVVPAASLNRRENHVGWALRVARAYSRALTQINGAILS